MTENAGIYLLVQLLLDHSVLDPGEVVEENVVLGWTGV